MAQLSSVELDHCRELVLLPGSVFEFTSRYVSKGKFDPLLAVYALNQAIGSIPLDHVDDAVKWAKLKWWSEEITAPPDAPSRHPVLRALWQSGARTKLDNTLLLRLVGNALSQVDVAPDPDENAMFERQADLGGTGIELELALNNSEICSRSMKYLGAATGVFRLISSFSVNHRSETTQLPLNVLAKHNVNAEQLETESHTTELAQIVTQLTQNALDWYSKGTSDMGMKPEPASCSHLQLRWAMEKRCLTAIRKKPGEFLKAGTRFGPADAWFAWRFLRKLG